ncbi:Putative nuclease HARBI1, partial [Cyphomyrmex costatus]
IKFQESSWHFKNFMRMSASNFEYLITLIGPKVQKKDTHFREAICVQERLALTLRFLISGDSYTSMQYYFKISKQSISFIVPEVCEALVHSLKMWNFPHCLGAIDGKHIVLQTPFNSGSEYFNYKKQFSIVLLVVVYANYNFIYVDVGCQGRISDGGIERVREIPYFFIGDEAFALNPYLMKVFPGIHSKNSKERIYNYRLCRTRRVVENAFGILTAKFRVLRKVIL